MEKYTFLHDLELMKKFKPDDFSVNACRMHGIVPIWENTILELIQITFDLYKADCKNQRRYDVKKDGNTYPNTWSLFSVDSRWNEENLKKGAQFLANHLNYLPEYIIDASYTILAECLGFKVYDKHFIFAKGEAEAKEFLELGKYHLSILMRMIMELGKLGIDCSAIFISTKPFCVKTKVEACLTPQVNTAHEILQNFRIRDDDLKRSWERSYAVSNQVYRTLCVNNLEEFFDTILKCIDLVCAYSDTMIPPEKIDFSKYYYPNEALPNSYDLPIGELTNAKDCIADFLEKLKKGAFIEQYYDIQLGRTIEEEKEEALIVNPSMMVVPGLLKSFIDYLLAKNYISSDQKGNTLMVTHNGSLEELWLIAHAFYKDTYGYAADLNDSKATAQINFLVQILIQVQNIHINYTYTLENKSDEIKEDLFAELMRKIQNIEDKQHILSEKQDILEGQVNTLRSDLDTLKEQIASYLENGKNKPVLDNTDRLKVIKIVRGCKTASLGAWVRKMLLMGTLVVGASTILNASAARNPEVVQSTSDGSIPIENYENVEIHKRPIYPHVSGRNPDSSIETLPVVEEKISMHMFEMVNGTRDYYKSAFDKKAIDITSQEGIVIRYYAFQNDALIGSFGTERALQEFISAHDVKAYTWKAAVSCVDYQRLSQYIESDTEISLKYTTFFTDYSPNVELVQKRQIP